MLQQTDQFQAVDAPSLGGAGAIMELMRSKTGDMLPVPKVAKTERIEEIDRILVVDSQEVRCGGDPERSGSQIEGLKGWGGLRNRFLVSLPLQVIGRWPVDPA